MSCEIFEGLLALYIENDLDGAESSRIERHLEACAGCREFLEELRESQRALKSLGRKPVSEAAFEHVRGRVLERIDRSRRPRYWGWALAVAAACVPLGFFFYPRTAPPAPPQPRVAVLPSEEGTLPAVPAPVMRPAPRPRKRVEQTTTAKSQPLVIKMVTEDPNVVIYWITDSSGE